MRDQGQLTQELARLRHGQAALKFMLGAIRLSHLTSKFDPDQPRLLAGSPGGGQWAGGGRRVLIPILPPYLDHARDLAASTVSAALNLYNSWTLQNTAELQAILTFQARQFLPGKDEKLDILNVKRLDADQVAQACPKLEEVKSRTDMAARLIARNFPGLSASQFGDAVHLNIKNQIDSLRDSNFRAEISHINSGETRYGRPGSIRIDVLERTGSGIVCAYDIKTGERGLSKARIAEIANSAFGLWGKDAPIIVTEIRPKR